jgi:ABC-type phosphate/phosphonate transport system substrate-binding protein
MRWLRALALVLAPLGMAFAQPPAASGEAAGLRPARLYAIVSGRVLSHVNRDDARAALKVWFDLLAQRKGFLLDSRVDILDSVAEIRGRLQSHSVDELILGISEFLELESSHLAIAVTTDSRGAQATAGHSYVLLAALSGATSLADLRRKNIAVYSRSADNTGLVWLEVLLNQGKLGRAASFFASIKLADKPQSCVLPLFFGTVDACVVDRDDLDLAIEMNPQLRKLKTLARSGLLIDSVLAMPVEPHPYRKELVETMLTLQDDPRGRQMLMVFKSDRLVAVQPGDLEAARELWKAYNRLPPEKGF